MPTAVAAFPDPVFPPPPKSQIRKTYNVVQWTEMEEGGHFAVLEQPELLLADIRRFFDKVENGTRSPRSTVIRSGAAAAAAVGAAALYTSFKARRIEAEVSADGRFIDVPGARIHYVDRGSGQPIVLLHGLGAQLRNFSYGVADELAATHRVILIDRPGFGIFGPGRGAARHPRAGRRRRRGDRGARSRSSAPGRPLAGGRGRAGRRHPLPGTGGRAGAARAIDPAAGHHADAGRQRGQGVVLYGRDDQVVDPKVDGERAVAAIPSAVLEMTEGGHMLR